MKTFRLPRHAPNALGRVRLNEAGVRRPAEQTAHGFQKVVSGEGRLFTAISPRGNCLPVDRGKRFIAGAFVDVTKNILSRAARCHGKLCPCGAVPVACNQPIKRSRLRAGPFGRRRRRAGNRRVVCRHELGRSELFLYAVARPLPYAHIPSHRAVARALAMEVRRARSRHG